MPGPRDLTLCSATLLHAGFRELVEAAAAGGFQGISLWPQDWRRALAEGLRPPDMRSLLADHGLVVTDLDPLLTWLPAEAGGVDPGRAPDAQESDFYAIAEALGARTLNAMQGFGSEIDRDRAAEAFAGLCERAAEHGLRVSLEFLPWSGIPDLATAVDILERAGRPDAGVTLDTWHFFRGPTTFAQLRSLPGARVGSVQMSDAPAEPTSSLLTETMDARLLPGEGAAPLVDLIRTLDAIGSRAPIGVEVISKALRELPPAEAGRRCGASARAILAAARDSASPEPVR
jgi:sugar phosphate isomerase/epimerase